MTYADEPSARFSRSGPAHLDEGDVGPLSTVLQLCDVRLTRSGENLLEDINWTVSEGSRWILLGANGSGKTSLIRIASMYEHPSAGTVEFVGQMLGRTDVRRLRRRLALVSPAMADMIRPQLTAEDVVVSAKFAALEPWWHSYDEEDRALARSLIESQGVGFAAGRRFGSLSSGERQRVLLARALMSEPALVLLDEPTSGLDLGGREALVDRLEQLATDLSTPPTVLVTHHVEEIPASFTHLLALKGGRILSSGLLADTLDAELLSDIFDLQLSLTRHSDGRFSARRRR